MAPLEEKYFTNSKPIPEEAPEQGMRFKSNQVSHELTCDDIYTPILS